MKKLNIAVFLGGTSTEREVSLASGKAVVSALREAGHNAIPIDPALGIHQPTSADELLPEGVHTTPPTQEELAKLSPRNIIECINSSLLDDIDVVFLALHGEWGEDGKIQSLLEMRGIKYTGSDVMSSALTMDKSMTKVLMKHVGVQTGTWFMVNASSYDVREVERRTKKEIGFPAVVKPNDQGSTVGLTILHNENESMNDALQKAAQFTHSVMVEEYISGRELTVSIVGDQVLPIIEICPKGGFYDYHHKYTKGMTEYICPAELDAALTKKIQQQAMTVFTSTQCKGYARVDFRLREDGEFFCLEINTLPGMTATSLVPKSAAAAGISFPALCERIVALAL